MPASEEVTDEVAGELAKLDATYPHVAAGRVLVRPDPSSSKGLHVGVEVVVPGRVLQAGLAGAGRGVWTVQPLTVAEAFQSIRAQLADYLRAQAPTRDGGNSARRSDAIAAGLGAAPRMVGALAR